MRSFLLPLSDPALDRHSIEVSLKLAARYQGHVTAVLAPTDFSCVPAFAEYPTAPGWAELVEQTRQLAKLREAEVRQVFNEMRQSGVTGAGDQLYASGSTVSLRVLPGIEEEVVAGCAVTHDVVLFPRKTRSEAPPLMASSVLKSALKDCGRPILVITDEVPENFARVIAIAWNGSMEAARAVTASLPLLSRAERVVILTFVTPHTEASKSEDLQLYLSRHEISTEVQVHEVDRSVGEGLLAAVQGLSAELLVMGGYTRSRARQTLFGAVTHHILENSSVPLLMAR